MTWLYLPSTCLASVPESEGSNSASASPSTIGDRLHAASAMWRGKQQQPQAWSRRWKRGGFIRLLSGVTLPPSTAGRGVASFIFSLRETPVRTTAQPESVSEPPESGSSPPRSSASPKSAGLILSSARTSLGTLTGSSRHSSHHWRGWATALRREYSARPRPEIPCGASDCSSWHGPRCNNPEKRGFVADDPRNGLAGQGENWSSPKASDPEKAGPNMRGSKGDVSLPGQAVQWEAPSVALTNGTRKTRSGNRSDELLLTGQAEETASRFSQERAWPAPAVRDHKGSSADSITRKDGKSRADMLDFAAEQFFRPPSSPDRPIAGGSMFSTGGPNSNRPSVRRKLNPIFVEALMRWPTGLSGFERQEMAWTLFVLLMPSFLSALCSTPTEKQSDLFGDAA